MSDLQFNELICEINNSHIKKRHMRKLISSKNDIDFFLNACVCGNLEVAKILFKVEFLKHHYEYIIEHCCINGHINILEWLFSMHTDHKNINNWFQLAAIHGKVSIMAFLNSSIHERHKIDMHNALMLSSENRQYDAIKFICSYEPGLSLCKH